MGAAAVGCRHRLTYSYYATCTSAEWVTDMQTKLTLRLDEALIARAKRYAARSGQSVSELVAKLFATLDDERPPRADDLPPITRALFGIMAGQSVDEDDYKAYLEEKHR